MTRPRALAAAFLLCFILTGCAGFFPPLTGTGTGTGTGTTASTTGDYVYTVNSLTNQLTGYALGPGSLSVIAGLPLTLTTGLAAATVTVSRPNSFVFVGGAGAVACYTIGTNGVLSAATAGGSSATASFTSLDTSPDGKWLFALATDNQTLNTDLFVYAINTATGALTVNSSLVVVSPSAQTVVPREVRIAPSGNVLAVALGTAGDVVYTFNTTTGVLTPVTNVFAPGFSDNAILFDANSAFLYFARAVSTTGPSGIASYSVTSAALLTPVQTLAPSGSSPFALAFESTGTYLYAVNKGDSTVSGYSAAAGTLTPLAGSPFASNVSTTALVRDNSGKYLVGLGTSGTNDLTLFSQDAITPGKLNAAVSASTGSAGATKIAATHTASGL